MNVFRFKFPKGAKIPDVEAVAIELRSRDLEKSFIRAIACLDKNDPAIELMATSEAYFGILNSSLSRISNDILSIVHVPPGASGQPSQEMHSRLYAIMYSIVESIKNERRAFLGTICDKLVKDELVNTKPSDPAAPSPGPRIAIDPKKTAQLAFILFGALAMLYVPVPDPEPGKLQMRASNSNPGSQRRSTATWHIGSQELGEGDMETSFSDLLFRYCRHHHGPIPKPRVKPRGVPLHGERQTLKSQNVSFYTLAKLLNVKLYWTASICEHLEFNMKTKVLKVFRLPSYCYVMCLKDAKDPDRTFLDNLFLKLLDDREDLVAADFFREVIATYRLIFGQHKDSRKLIKTYCSRGRFLGMKSPFRNPHPSAFIKEHADPLLERLCFHDSREETIFNELEMLNLKNIYVLDTDFPYFADRLWALQEFVENQCPNDWKILWRDRRDIAKFWTIWAVMLFGIPTVLLAILQTILTGFQLRSSPD